jgi:hypothetical protein
MARIGSKRAAHSRRLLLGFVSCVTLASVAGLAGASVAAAAPVINSESVSHVGEHEATLEAQLEPDGLETKYEFWLQYNACQSNQGASCEAIIVRSVGEGFIGAADTSVRVSASLPGLQAGYSYTFFVYAQNNGGWVKGESREFKATSNAGGSLVTEPEPLPIAENKAKPYESTISPGTEQSAAEASERVVSQAQREKDEHEAGENQAPQPGPVRTTAAITCGVPRLKGDSLTRARAALVRNHCSVGHVTRPRKSQRKLVVVAQSHSPGTKLPRGAAVALKLGT